MKLIKRLVLLAVVGVVVVVVAGWIMVAPASRTAVEKAGRYALGVETTLDEVDLSLGVSSSSVGFRGLSIANPEGIAGDPFLDITAFSVGVRTLSLMSTTVKVPAVQLEGLHLRLIQDGERSNFREIVGYLRRQGGGGEDQAPSVPPTGDTGAGPSLALGSVSVKGVQASLELRGVPGMEPLTRSFSLPDFEFDMNKYLGASPGNSAAGTQASVADLTGGLIDQLVELAVAEAANYVDPEVAALLQGNLQGALEGKLRGKLQDRTDGLLDGATEDLDKKLGEELGQELGGKLKGLLGDG
jgi:hypothetical protein